MQIIILAAGVGERLLPLTYNTPKSLITLGNGLTILESQLKVIKFSGINEVNIVVGYLAEQIEAKIKLFNEKFEMKINLIFNPFYRTSNNLISLWFAKYYMNDDFIIINGDDVFKNEVLTGLLDVDKSKEICMTIDEKKEYDADDMKIFIENNLIKKIGKELPLNQANGESVGIIRVLGSAKNKLINTLELMVREEKNKNIYYLSAFQNLINQGFQIHSYKISENDWGEIDFHPDLKIVQKHINSLDVSWDNFSPNQHND